jgi:hypothetical protein
VRFGLFEIMYILFYKLTSMYHWLMIHTWSYLVASSVELPNKPQLGLNLMISNHIENNFASMVSSSV